MPSELHAHRGGLSKSQVKVLTFLQSHPQHSHSLLKLAHAIDLSDSTVRLAIGRLNDLGYIRTQAGNRSHAAHYTVLKAPPVPLVGTAISPQAGTAISPQGYSDFAVGGTAISPQPLNKERARVTSLTHLKTSQKERVSECTANQEQIRKAMEASFPFTVSRQDPLLAELELITLNAGLGLEALFHWFVYVRETKGSRRYPIHSAGAIRDWAKRDLAGWAASRYRKPMTRAEEREAPPLGSVVLLDEEIAWCEGFLAEFPSHAQTRQRLASLRQQQSHRYAKAAAGGPQ